MSRATTGNTTAPEAEGVVVEIVMEVIETADVLGGFLCTTRPVTEDAGILVSPAQPSGDEVPAGYRSAYWSRH
ncbi:MAG TPA: hypothetical protein VIT66_04380 [Lysobacter sp.]|jgi:hypothetical protein